MFATNALVYSGSVSTSDRGASPHAYNRRYGWTVTRREGALKTIATTDADGERAKRVVEELTRLRGQGELKDNALLRCNVQLDQLELELNDYLVQLNSSSLPQVHVQAKEVAVQINQLQNDRDRNSSVYGSRSSNRKALGIGKRTRDWSSSLSNNNNESAADVLTLPTDLPWREALSVNRIDPRTGLGDGTPPPGHRAAGGRTLLGIDLVGDTPVGLTVRGLGGDTSIELSVTRPAPAQWPLLSSLVATLALALSALALHRRR